MLKTSDIEKYLIEKEVVLNPDEIKEHKVASLMPMIRSEEREELKRDIQINGQLEPIFVMPTVSNNSEHKYWIVDGRNRADVCKELGIGVIANIYKNIIPGKLLEQYVKSIHKRRNLTPDQKAYMAYEHYMKLKTEGVKVTQAEVAKQYVISNKQLSYITKIVKHFGINSAKDIYLYNKAKIMDKTFTGYKGMYDFIMAKEKSEKNRGVLGSGKKEAKIEHKKNDILDGIIKDVIFGLKLLYENGNADGLYEVFKHARELHSKLFED